MSIDFGKCCGGNDGDPQEHTQDCWHSINRFVANAIAAQALIDKPSNGARARLVKALKPLPSVPRTDTASPNEGGEP